MILYVRLHARSMSDLREKGNNKKHFERCVFTLITLAVFCVHSYGAEVVARHGA